MSGGSRLGLTWRLLRAEGVRSLYERWIDHRRDARRRNGFRLVDQLEARRLASRVEVLNLLATAPLLRLGGLQQQLVARLDVETSHRDAALLYPERERGWRLEITAGKTRVATTIGGRAEDVDRAVRSAVDLTGARLLHVEGLAGFDLDALAAAATAAPACVVSLHDFAAATGRLHVAARSSEREPERERRAAAVLRRARAVVFPSEFLRREHRRLLPDTDGDWRVIAPGLRWSSLPQDELRSDARRHIAFVGQAAPHKGIAVFERIQRALAGAAGAVERVGLERRGSDAARAAG